ncbi:MAG: DUF418 domain-containing protein [Caulobacter sp.]|nr:DUF418 domain-containing protein [Caulobacter sp.]
MTETTVQRHQSIDAVRGFAVLGILLMNIVGMGLPSFAYIDPTYYGGHEGANLWAWAINFVLADGKMRGLFTMLFGASMLLIADRAEGRRPGPAATHYRRMLWLFVIGMLHAYLLFFGDILVTYAIAGALVFFCRKWGPRTLIGFGAAILLALLAKGMVEAHHLGLLREAATAPGASAETVKAWQEASFYLSPPAEFGEAELRGYRGGFLDAVEVRAQMAVIMQTFYLLMEALPEAVGQMLVGMGLFKLGFFTLGWKTRSYAILIAVGWGIGVPLTAVMAWATVQSGFDPIHRQFWTILAALPRPFIALAHASALLLLVRSGALDWLVSRLAAAGRMAFTNYLGTSIITAILFCGFGFGLYGALERAELYWVVAGIWAVILLWSKPWLARFQYGPFEWIWRSLVMWKPQPFLKR